MTDNDTAGRRLLDQLNPLVGDWVEQVHLPGVPAGRMSFRWIIDNQFLLERPTTPEPEFPDSTCIIAVNDDPSGYTQHYCDSRGIVRTYTMTLDERRWTLLRHKTRFHCAEFAQRFTGTSALQCIHHHVAGPCADDGTTTLVMKRTSMTSPSNLHLTSFTWSADRRILLRQRSDEIGRVS
jgi:hypothetical protein